MAGNRREKALLWASVMSFLLMSATFLLMPLEEETVYTGILFWVTFLIGIGTQIALDVLRKKFFKKNRVNYRKNQKKFCGAFTFFSNLPAKIADIALPLSAVGLGLSLWLTRSMGYVCYVFLSLTVFALTMHCVFNGRNYFFALNKPKIYTIIVQKRTMKTHKGEGMK